MFAIARLPNALVSAVVDQLSIRELTTLQRVNNQFRAEVNKRLLFPRKVSRFCLAVEPVQCSENGCVDDECNPELWALAFTFYIIDVDGWSISLESRRNQDNAVQLRNEKLFLVFRSGRWTLDRLVKCLSSRPRSMAVDRLMCEFSLDADGKPDSELVRAKNVPVRQPELFEVSSLLRLVATMKELAFCVPHSPFDYLKKFRQFYGGDAEVIRFGTPDHLVCVDRTVRCQQCVTRYGDDAPWGCVVCEEAWASWSSLKSSRRRPQQIAFDIRGFPVGVVGQLAGVAFCPRRPASPGAFVSVCRAFGERIENDTFVPEIFLQQFEGRLRRVHNGAMRVLDEADADAEILKEWMLQHHKRDGASKCAAEGAEWPFQYCRGHYFRHNFVVDVHGKRFLVAFMRESPCLDLPEMCWPCGHGYYIGLYLYIFEK